MQATIAYLLTEQAQRAQMAATGQPVARKQTTTEDIPSDLITHPLVQIGESGEMLVDLSRDTGINRDGTVACSWRSESGWAIIRAGLDYVPTSGVEAVRQRIVKTLEAAGRELARPVRAPGAHAVQERLDARHVAGLAAVAVALEHGVRVVLEQVGEEVLDHRVRAAAISAQQQRKDVPLESARSRRAQRLAGAGPVHAAVAGHLVRHGVAIGRER